MSNDPTPAPAAPPSSSNKSGLGMLGIFGVLMGGGCLLFAVLGLVNTALGWHLVLRVSGAEVEIPDDYEICVGLIAVGVLFIGFSLFGSFVIARFKEAKGKPAVRVAIVVGAVGLLVLAGRGLQIFALINTYGSMLAYYATDGDLEDVQAELAKGPTPEHLDAAVSRAAQYDNYQALELLLDAGADLRDASSPPEHRHCVLEGVGPGFVQVAIDHGVRPDSCPNSEALIWQVVRQHRDDATTAKVVELLAAAGWSRTAVPKEKDKPALEIAERDGLTATAELLRAGAQ